MEISSLHVKGFRNFNDALINFNGSTLVIGSNDVGKSNMLYALRMLLDKSLSESDIEPCELDFHLSSSGASNFIEITIAFKNISEDSVLSVLKGHVSDTGETYLRYTAVRSDLSYKLLVGHSLEELEEVNSRFYLKYINLKYIQSQRDLRKYIHKEKRQLLKISRDSLTSPESEEDADLISEISADLLSLNDKVSQLIYVDKATHDVNQELCKLAHHNSNYTVQLDSGAIQVNDFIENLQLSASTNGSNVMLGGDGRNNQILLALWKVKSMREHDHANEVVFFVIEEPEAHLHPHQQRKLAKYLVEELPGQSIISSHSPQIASCFNPSSIIRLLDTGTSSIAASDGCSSCISDSWDDMGYRISILPAEAFFSSGVLLVEGPSEVLFYKELSMQLGIDLDYLNISILSVDGIAFNVYTNILDALSLPWAIRTDNDISKVSSKELWQYAGFNRCLRLAGQDTLQHCSTETSSSTTVGNGMWQSVSDAVNPIGIFVSKVDLENDLLDEHEVTILAAIDKATSRDAVSYLQKQKAIRMRSLLKKIRGTLPDICGGELAKPLHFIKDAIVGNES